jgi:hypothetical protein
MKVTALLCDYAQVAEGKLYISGGGWNVMGPQPQSTALALIFEVPWTRTNEKIRFGLRLATADEATVTQAGPLGDDIPVQMSGELEVGRPAGVKAGSELNAPFAFAVPPLVLAPDTRYIWIVTVDGGTPPETRLPFTTRPAA